MQVLGVSIVGKSQNTKRIKKASTASIFSLDDTEKVEAASEEFEIAETNSVSSLLAIHNFKDKIDLEKKTLEYSEDILRNLDDMVRSMAHKKYSASDSLAKLSKTLVEHRERSDNPRLEELSDEIEMRALIEKAKLTKQK